MPGARTGHILASPVQSPAAHLSGLKVPMTIRRKIFLLAGILLALFGLVVGVLAVVQKFDSDQIGNIVGYELPLSQLLSEFDVDTDRYELRILRLLRLDSLTP